MWGEIECLKVCTLTRLKVERESQITYVKKNRIQQNKERRS